MAVRSADGRKRRIAVFTGPGPDPETEEIFRKAFTALGFRVGTDLEIEYWRVPMSDWDKTLPAVAGKIAASGPDLAITWGSVFTGHLRRGAPLLPIVADIGDPVATGVAQSLARPGGNVTGLSQGQAEVAVKQVELLRELFPRLERVGWIAYRPQLAWLPTFEKAAREVGLPVIPLAMTGAPLDIERLRPEFAALPAKGCHAAFFYSGQAQALEVVAALARQYRVALVSSDAAQAETDGVLFSYSAMRPAGNERLERLAFIAARVLRGERPAAIAFEGPTHYGLVINQRTASRLGLAIPPHVLVRAHKVIT